MRLRNKILSVVAGLLAVTVGAAAVVLSHDTPCAPAAPLPAGATPMQAAVYRCYGSPDVIKLETVAKPAEVDDRMVVKVHAAAVNPLDWHYMRGEPYIGRPLMGIGAPRSNRLGVDFAGTVESVGKSVTQYKPGDEVYGGRDGAFGEFVSVAEKGPVALKPANMSFEQAAAVPIAGVTALQALRDKGNLRAGQSVLINGASGGVGTFAVQIAKAYGATVTGVCSAKNFALVKSIGADQLIDYTKEDFTQGAQRYDLIIDTVSAHSFSEYRRVLKPHGIVVIVGSPNKERWFSGLLDGITDSVLIEPFVSEQQKGLLASLNPKDLAVLAGMMQAGKITPVIDRRYPLAEVPEAIRYLELGHARGKVIVSID